MNNWKRIETAPKDGTFVLLCERSGYVHVKQWCLDGYWRYRVVDEDAGWDPTHWQLLPTPPES